MSSATSATSAMWVCGVGRVPGRAVHRPWQGHTTVGLPRLPGGTEPTEVPGALDRAALAAGAVLSVFSPASARTRGAWR